MREVLKDLMILALAAPNIALFTVLLMGRTVGEPNKIIAATELSLSILVLLVGLAIFALDLRRLKR